MARGPFDSVLLCVDGLSGWVIARPTRKAGLNAQKAAHLIMDNGWETFGLPAIITSDQGPQFVGQWWRTMRAGMGIRQVYSQAYRPQANGRAEVTGKVLIGLMRKVWVEDQINWVEALPQILRVYHDSPGESGMSPFEIGPRP
jgi:transposase InsO family protein